MGQNARDKPSQDIHTGLIGRRCAFFGESGSRKVPRRLSSVLSRLILNNSQERGYRPVRSLESVTGPARKPAAGKIACPTKILSIITEDRTLAGEIADVVLGERGGAANQEQREREESGWQESYFFRRAVDQAR